MGQSSTFHERYRAIEARDTRFDGQFVTAVLSTGIYCRPSCPARTPKPQNVTFYPTSAAAHEAGFRACKRCLPEAAPGSPEWDLRSDAAARAMRLIAEGIIEREGVSGLAARLGYSSRHLTRMLRAQLGAGPLALARAQRAHTARMLLVETALPASDVAFSAGFASIRQFNDTLREVFGLTPTQLRARGGSRPGNLSKGRAVSTGSVTETGAQAGVSISLALPVREPFDSEGLFAWMAARALPGIETADGEHYARTLRLPGGTAWFRVRSAGRELRLDARLAALGDLPLLVARVRRLFDLDADPQAIDQALSRMPAIAPLVARVPGIRVPGAADPHEMLIRAMVGQQVSVAAARTALGRVGEALGERMPEQDGTDRLFPTMSAIARRGAEVLRGPGARIRAVVGAARAVAEGSLTLSSADDPVQQRDALLAMPGIGPWTADYVRMRVTGAPDVFLPGDAAVRAGAVRAGLPADPRRLLDHVHPAAPWRSYLTAHLWRTASDPEETA